MSDDDDDDDDDDSDNDDGVAYGDDGVDYTHQRKLTYSLTDLLFPSLTRPLTHSLWMTNTVM